MTVALVRMLVAMLAASLSMAVTLGQGENLMSLMVWNGGSLVQDG